MKLYRRLLVPSLLALLASPMSGWTADPANIIRGIRIDGIKRVEPETVKSYLSLEEGGEFDPVKTRKSIQALFKTGFFKDVELEREGNTLVVRVVENPMVDEVVFEGGEAYSAEDLKKITQIKSRSIFDRAKADRDLAALRQAFRIKGLFLAEVEMQIKHLDENRIKVVYKINEGEKSKVREVRIVGNNAFKDKELMKKMMIQPSGWFSWFSDDDTYDREKLLFDQEQLRNYYLDHGYAKARVETSVAELTADRSAFVVTHNVTEGDLYHFGAIRLQTDFNELPQEELEKKIEIVEGDMFSRGQLRKTLETLSDVIGDYGYAFMDVQPITDLDDENKKVDVLINIRKGRRVYLNRIEVSGNTRTRDEVVRRELRMVEGDRFSTSQVKRSKERLKNLDFFETVEVVTPSSGESDRVDVQVHVEEKSTGTFTIGAGYSSLDNFIGMSSISQNNFLGRGQRVVLSFALSSRITEFNISFSDPYFMGERVAFGMDVYNHQADRRNLSGYKQESYGTGFRFGFPISEYLTNWVSYGFANIELKDIPSYASRSIKEQAALSPYTVSTIGDALIWDSVDSKLVPTKGRRHKLGGDFAGVGGDVKYVRLSTDNSLFMPIFRENLVGHVRFRAGVIHPLGDRDIPMFERYYVGGSNSLRGFKNAGVGPRTKEGEAYGGTHMETLSTELLFPFFALGDKGVRGVAFFDMGTVGNLDGVPVGTYNDNSIRMSTGAGVHWNSPFGPLKFELGFPLTKTEYDRTRTFDFSIGAAM
ncbi:MAG: outer membrane protein assembly factor BamA [Magnetococcales bacterium]|nr:outer membrane protein assembly factor BamA [Magnetococcales bacterium]NGZ25680.1 outer membrane protein assembly factor BamA [Magnetococcales bacterium]